MLVIYLNREIEKLCAEMNQLRISNAALCTALGELSTRIDLANSQHDGIKTILKKQLKIQEHIFETKGKEIKLPQQDFYPQILAELKEIKNLLTPV